MDTGRHVVIALRVSAVGGGRRLNRRALCPAALGRTAVHITTAACTARKEAAGELLENFYGLVVWAEI